ncbi:cytochrome P450 4C1-like [Coccinella septempunctata]|uniref:cytochrome P450 4C1-like n=1 Tax=Coccinella septempunctata TaxID=41139 RepID=UPI001D08A0DB|nr:cytochrome P450 4C1-like [Coccinella septempunctata]
MFTLILILVCVIFLVKLFISRNDGRNFKEIPGPKGLPVFGNIQDYFLTDEKLWIESRARALEFYPIYKLKTLNKTIVHIVDPKDAEVVLSNPRYMTKGDTYGPFKVWMGNGLLVTEGEIWRKSRKLLTKCFHFNALRNKLDLLNSAALKLASILSDDNEKPTDLVKHLGRHSLRVAIASFVGEKPEVKNDAAKQFLKALQTLTKITTYKIFLPILKYLYLFTSMKREEDKAVKIFHGFTSYLIEGNSNLDITENSDETRLLNVLLTNFQGQQVKDHLNTILFGGQDSTSTALSFILYVLSNKQHFQDELYNEIMEVTSDGRPSFGEINQMNLLDRFVKECFRLYPPAHFVGRHINEKVPLPSGYTIPAGAMTLIHIYDIHHNPKIYPEPDKFDPDRFLPENIQKRHPFSFIPFSAGPRNCIAQKFALLSIKTALCGLLTKFRIEPVGSLEDIVLIPDILLKTKYPLKVIFRPRIT